MIGAMSLVKVGGDWANASVGQHTTQRRNRRDRRERFHLRNMLG
jgi:hypothetical protein